MPAGRRVDPHRLADEVRTAGFMLQHQPGYAQSDGTSLPRSVHLTITPVTETVMPDLLAAVSGSADRVRGKRPHSAASIARIARALYPRGNRPSPAMCALLLRLAGTGGGVPGRLGPLMALIEALPTAVTEALLTELLARASED